VTARRSHPERSSLPEQAPRVERAPGPDDRASSPLFAPDEAREPPPDADPRPALDDSDPILADLSAVQRRCATHTGAPLLVLAGPGTGKTRVIVHRIAWALSRRNVAPETLLACTFSVRAAEEMRTRVQALVGPAIASRVQVRTIHAYGAGLVRRFADRLGARLGVRLGSRGPTLMDAAQRRRVIREVVEGQGLFRNQRAGGLDALAERLVVAFDALADLGVEPERAVAFAKVERDRAGEGLREEGDDDASLAEKVEDLGQTALAYRECLAHAWSRGMLSYADFVTLPFWLLSRDAGALALARAGAREIIVDEFQDCNAANIRLVALLAGTQGPGALCAVGDDDQAIYSFRGADTHAFRRFASLWPHHVRERLVENRRSGRQIVRVANAIIARSHDRFDAGKLGTPSDNASDEPIEFVRLASDHEDAPAIAAMLARERELARAEGRAINWSDFGVLARGHSDLERVSVALSAGAIPWERVVDRGILASPAVQELRAWCEWVVQPDAIPPAALVLTRAPARADAAVVAEWSRAWRAEARADARADARTVAGTGPSATDRAQPPNFPRWLRARLQALPEGDARLRVLHALDLRDQLQAASAERDGPAALDAIVQRALAPHVNLLPGRERAQRIAALVAMMRWARDTLPAFDAPGDLRSLLAYWQELEAADPRGDWLKARQIDAGEDPDPGGEASVRGGPDADAPGEVGRVSLLTAHASKGLEFGTVFVTRVRSPNGFPSSEKPRPWTPPAALAWDAPEPIDARQRHDDEERRMFYVACTRAKRRLVLLAMHTGRPSSARVNFFAELLAEVDKGLRAIVTRSSDLGVGEARALAGPHASLDALEVELRAAAGLAMDSAARAQGARTDLHDQLRLVADGLAMVNAARLGHAPATDGPLAQRVRAILVGERAEHATDHAWTRPKPPLRLSYSQVNAFEKCPRCWYVRHVLDLPERASSAAALGNAAHHALEEFYRAWSEADADGGAKPDPSRLVALARAAWVREVAQQGPRGAERDALDSEELGTLEAQMTLFARALHDPKAHVLEVERRIVFPFVVDGVEHRMEAKLDRVDLLPDGGARLVDYKTGSARKDLREPAKGDLQMGIYAMALASEQGEVPAGRAEYWLLSTGEVGAIDLRALDVDKARARVEKAVRTMLSGPYPQGRSCMGGCEVLGPMGMGGQREGEDA
jgi:DNA helicase-2/ATP-dependent DNA helicase PcrA